MRNIRIHVRTMDDLSFEYIDKLAIATTILENDIVEYDNYLKDE